MQSNPHRWAGVPLPSFRCSNTNNRENALLSSGCSHALRVSEYGNGGARVHTHGPSTKQMTQACVRPATRSAQRPPHTNTTHSTDGRYATDVYSRARPAERRPSAPVADRCAQPRWWCVGSHRTTLRCTTWAQAEGVPLVQCKHRIISYWDTTARLDGILRDEILERGKRRTNPCFIYSSTVQQSLATAADA
jgi:hypothetical protein